MVTVFEFLVVAVVEVVEVVVADLEVVVVGWGPSRDWGSWGVEQDLVPSLPLLLAPALVLVAAMVAQE